MRIRKFLLISLILLLISGLCFGQEIVEDENWLKGFGTEADYLPSLIYPFQTFTQGDVAKGKQRLNSVRQFKPKNVWEGIYYSNVEIGDSKLIWNKGGGFFSFYFYHYLKRFYFGKVNDLPDSVDLIYEKTPVSLKGRSNRTKLIKVKIHKKHFLVPENRLQDFCERAAGLSTSLGDFNYYWIREEDMRKEISGLPELPSKYKNFLRYPIAAIITRVGRRKIAKANTFPSSEEIHYYITLNQGKNKGLKKQMNFFVEDLGEWIQITKVFQTSSIGFIRRDFDENKQEQCFNSEGGSGQIIPCKEIKIGMKARTKGSI